MDFRLLNKINEFDVFPTLGERECIQAEKLVFSTYGGGRIPNPDPWSLLQSQANKITVGQWDQRVLSSLLYRHSQSQVELSSPSHLPNPKWKVESRKLKAKSINWKAEAGFFYNVEFSAPGMIFLLEGEGWPFSWLYCGILSSRYDISIGRRGVTIQLVSESGKQKVEK